MTRQRWLISAGIIASIVLLVGGGRFIVYPLFMQSPDSVHIIVTSVQPVNASSQVVFDEHFTQQANAIYQRLAAEVPISSQSPPSCPISPNQKSHYHFVLIFFHAKAQIAMATSDAYECQTITVDYADGSQRKYSWQDQHGTSFWEFLHGLVNTPEPTPFL